MLFFVLHGELFLIKSFWKSELITMRRWIFIVFFFTEKGFCFIGFIFMANHNTFINSLELFFHLSPLNPFWVLKKSFKISQTTFFLPQSETLKSTDICDPMSLINLLCNEIDQTKVDMVKYLSHPDENGHTPLHMGCQRGATISCMQLKKVRDTVINRR